MCQQINHYNGNMADLRIECKVVESKNNNGIAFPGVTEIMKEYDGNNDFIIHVVPPKPSMTQFNDVNYMGEEMNDEINEQINEYINK